MKNILTLCLLLTLMACQHQPMKKADKDQVTVADAQAFLDKV